MPLFPLRSLFVDGLLAYVGALVRRRQGTINDLRDPVINVGHSVIYGKYLFPSVSTFVSLIIIPAIPYDVYVMYTCHNLNSLLRKKFSKSKQSASYDILADLRSGLRSTSVL